MIQPNYPNAPAMSTAFAVPSPDEQTANPDYWNGYKAAQATAAQNCPSATNIPDWGAYHATVLASVPPVKPFNASGVGANQAIFDASNWEWLYNPQSGHNKVF
jgi:hypothetical protein